MSIPHPEPRPPLTAEATVPVPAPVRADSGLLVMVVIWALNFSVIKLGLDAIEPLAFNALRFPLAALFVFVVLRMRGPIPLPAPGDRLRVLLLGLVGNVGYQYLFIAGIDRTRAGNASLLLAATPILTGLLSAWVGHERLDRRIWSGVVATFLGIALVVAAGGGGIGIGLDTLAGDLLLVGASAVWAVYTVGARDPIARYGSVAVTAWTLWVGTVGVALLGVPQLAATDLSAVPLAAWGAVVYAGCLGIGLAYLLWYQGVRHVGNTRTAVYSNLVPVLAILVAWVWLGEVPSFWQLVGAAVIIGGVTLTRTRV